jgi:hypothetical protein
MTEIDGYCEGELIRVCLGLVEELMYLCHNNSVFIILGKPGKAKYV